MSVNLNDLAKEITLREGGKKSLSIAQCKEVIRLYNQRLNEETDAEIIKVVRRNGGKKR